MDLFECRFPLKKEKKKSQIFQPKPCNPKANTSCFCPCCTVHKFPGHFFLRDFFIMYADLIMESEIISRKIFDCRCVSYGKYVPDPEGWELLLQISSKRKARSSRQRGRNPISLFSGSLQSYCFTKARGSQPCARSQHKQRSPVHLRWLFAPRWKCCGSVQCQHWLWLPWLTAGSSFRWAQMP